jgi:hypothetical protein
VNKYELQNEGLHNLYSSPNNSRMTRSKRMRWTGHVARMGEERKACTILVIIILCSLLADYKPRSLVLEYGVTDWIDLAQDRDR